MRPPLGLRSILLPVLFLSIPALSSAQFTNIGSVPLSGVQGLFGDSWGDFDQDGDLDVLVMGPVTRVYRNNGEAFPTYVSYGVDLPAASAIWADEDRDGDLDIVLTATADYRFRVFRSSGGANPVFSDAGGIPASRGSPSAWGDWDNDGDLDPGSSANNEGPPFANAVLYRSRGGTPPIYQNAFAALPAATLADVSWADYDNDGDLDLYYAGYSGGAPQAELARIIENQGGGVFEETAISIQPVGGGASAWGDYDNDGDLDLVVLGQNTLIGLTTRLYRNSGGADPTLDNTAFSFIDLTDGSAAWGDYDNDGDRDLVISGQTHGSPNCRAGLFRNNGGSNPTFTFSGLTFDDIGGHVAWGDHDGDGDLDLLIGGFRNIGSGITRVYRNDLAGPSNLSPSTPTGLASVESSLGAITLSWDASTDDTTPPAGLTYQIRVGTTPGGCDVVSPSAILATGELTVPADGNCGHTRFRTLNLTRGTYYWSVQAIDAGYRGSPFASEQTSTVTTAVGNVTVDGFSLGAPTPNPMTSEGRIPFVVPRDSHVRVEVLDLAGRRLATLVDGSLGAGTHEARWNVGTSVPAGVYHIRIEAGAFRMARRVIVLP